MSGTVGNIIARVGADVSPLTEDMKKAQNTILTFKDESLAALKSFGLPHISSTNLVESIQSGQRVIVNFAKESGESLAQFQQRVRTTFEETGIDITAYETALLDADKVHAEFAKGAVKNFQAVSAAAEEVNNTAEELRSSLGTSFTGIQANVGAFKESVVDAFKTLTDGSASFGDKIGAVSNAVVDGFGLMTGALEIFIAVEVVKKVGEWIEALQELAAETQDAEHRFYASMGSMSDVAEEFSKNLAESYGIDQEAIQGMMAKEYTNTRMLGFDPTQAESMSEHLTQMSYDLGKLRGVDPSQAFDALQRGIEGQTRGLMQLGIRITTTDLKNRALKEGLIKQGQTMTDAQTSAVAYQMIMEKLQGTTGYYKTTADDLSSQQAKLNVGWEEMKRKLAGDLTPAFTGLMRVVSFVATGIEQFVEVIGTAIQTISLFAEDAYSAVNDILSLNFGQINADWDNNYASIFNSSEAAKQYGNSMDSATSAANAQNAAQKALNKSVNANTMSFDQLHNITNSGAAAAQGQTAAVNNLADALGNLKNAGMADITNTESKGIIIPLSFKVPPFPPIPPPPAVPVFAVDHVSPVVRTVKAELTSLPNRVSVPVVLEDRTQPVYGQVQTKLETFTPKLINVPVSVIGEALLTTALQTMKNKLLEWKTEAIHCFNTVTETAKAWETSAVKAFNEVQTTITGWEALAVQAFNDVQGTTSAWEASATKSFVRVQSTITRWQTDAVAAFGLFATALATQFKTGFRAAEEAIHAWSVAASEDFSSFASNADTAFTTFGTQFQTDFQQALSATETMVITWATRVEQAFTSAMNSALSSIASLAAAAGHTLSNVGSSVGNWASNNKGLLATAGVAGLTIATGGADLVVGGIAAAGEALAGIGAGMAAGAIPALASGGIVTAPQLAMIGEAGPEAVIPLNQLSSLMNNEGNSSSNGTTANTAQPINVTLQLDGRTLARTMYSYTVNENDRIGTTIGYNSSYNLPK